MDDFLRGWKNYLIAGLGGGAFYGIADAFLAGAKLEGQVLGVTIKDLLTLLVTKYFADKTSGTWKTVFEGATVIGVYKVFYPGFIEPLVKGFLGTKQGTTTTTTTSTSTSPCESATEAAKAYISSS
jgi:hypothetical protein